MRLQRRLIISTMSIAATIFMATMIVVYILSKNHIVEAAEYEAQTQVNDAARLINSRLDEVEDVVDMAASKVLAAWHKHNTDSLMAIANEVVRDNPGIAGSAIAFEPGEYEGDDKHIMLYAYKDGRGDIISRTFTDLNQYDYTEMEWYVKPIATKNNGWSEPYFDDGGGEMLMCTYSHPIFVKGKVIGIFTADIDFKSIYAIVKKTGIDNSQGECIITNQARNIIYHSSESMLMKKAPGDDVSKGAMFTAAIPDTGWTIRKVVPHSDLLRPLQRAINYMMGLSIFTLLVLYFSLRYGIRRMSRPEVQRQARLDAELGIAKRIQEGMMPRNWELTGPAEGRVEIGAIIQAAKEIGGDFYNATIVGHHMHFIIADVSGKGIPAAIFMSLATKIYMSIVADDIAPAEMAGHLNSMLCHNNPTAMFTTAIIGRLNLTNGEVELCSAGHTPPMLMGEHISPEYLTLDTNIPLGLVDGFKFTQSTMILPPAAHLLLYTDGVTEAENRERRQLGSERFMSLAARSASMTAQEAVDSIRQQIRRFTNGYEQTDDITIFDIRYTGCSTDKVIISPDMAQLPKVFDLLRRLRIGDKIAVAVEEAVVNTISYSGATIIKVAISIDIDAITVTITDDGAAFNPLEYSPQEQNSDVPAVGGMGIKIYTSIMDEEEYIRTEHHNILKLIKQWKSNTTSSHSATSECLR